MFGGPGSHRPRIKKNSLSYLDVAPGTKRGNWRRRSQTPSKSLLNGTKAAVISCGCHQSPDSLYSKTIREIPAFESTLTSSRDSAAMTPIGGGLLAGSGMVEDGKVTRHGCEARCIQVGDVHPDAGNTSCLPSPASVPHPGNWQSQTASFLLLIFPSLTCFSSHLTLFSGSGSFVVAPAIPAPTRAHQSALGPERCQDVAQEPELVEHFLIIAPPAIHLRHSSAGSQEVTNNVRPSTLSTGNTCGRGRFST